MPAVRTTLTVVVGVALLTAGFSGPALAQQIQTVGGRTMLARVVDSRGRPQVDLGVDDFVVEEGGQERDVLDVHVADYPVAILIDDASMSTSDNLSAIKTSVARFISRIGERPVAISALSKPSALVATFETERAEVLTALQRMTSSNDDPQPLPAVANIVRLIRETGAPFSTIVIVAASPVDARRLVESTPLQSILETGTVINVIEQRSTPADTSEMPPDLFQVLSDQTHGQYTTIFSSASFAVALDRLADRLSTELMVEYLVPADAGGGDVRAGVRRPGAVVLGLGVK